MNSRELPFLQIAINSHHAGVNGPTFLYTHTALVYTVQMCEGVYSPQRHRADGFGKSALFPLADWG